MKKPEEVFALSWPVKGTSQKTGDWRIFKPVMDKEKCTKCQFCWVYCPEAVIDKDTLEIDYYYCKGCGICAKECPVKAIEMVREG